VANVSPVLSPLLSDISQITVVNISESDINTEKQHNLNTGLKQIIIRNRNEANTRISFASGGTSGSYYTIRRGSCLELSGLNYSGTLFYQVDKISELEIIEIF